MDSLKFGTSGLRGLVEDLVGAPSQAYTLAFLRHLNLPSGSGAQLLIGRDLRSSSPGIATDCALAATRYGMEPVDCGALPTPALALEALKRGVPAVMVTGSHIPDDRNGLKFYRPDGEITKTDETGILAAHVELDEKDWSGSGIVRRNGSAQGEVVDEGAAHAYVERYLSFFGAGALDGLRVGIYEHSSVARDLLSVVLRRLGADVEPLGRAEHFVPVDTEAHRPEDRILLREWAATGRWHAIVSTDGDADRPLVADEHGDILRGDVLGLITARHLGASTIVTPVTSSSAIGRAGSSEVVVRTRVGSPFVLKAMNETDREKSGIVIGFEANGGVLLGSDVHRDGRTLNALPTRDAFLPIIAALRETIQQKKPLSEIVAGLNAGFAAADRLQDVPSLTSERFLQRLASDRDFAATLFRAKGSILDIDTVDGVRIKLADSSIVHFRASGNAPELRCYVEAVDRETADTLLAWGLHTAEQETSAS